MDDYHAMGVKHSVFSTIASTDRTVDGGGSQRRHSFDGRQGEDTLQFLRSLLEHVT
jgi:hypothetical protein